MIRYLKILAIMLVLLSMYSCALSINPYGPISCSTWENKNCGATADCADLLYNKATALMIEGQQVAHNEFYMTASVKYRQAACLLKEARIRLVEAKLQDFDDWQVAVTLGLERKIKESIKQCDMFINIYRWR